MRKRIFEYLWVMWHIRLREGAYKPTKYFCCQGDYKRNSWQTKLCDWLEYNFRKYEEDV